MVPSILVHRHGGAPLKRDIIGQLVLAASPMWQCIDARV